MRYSEMIAREKTRDWHAVHGAELDRLRASGSPSRRWLSVAAVLVIVLGATLL